MLSRRIRPALLVFAGAILLATTGAGAAPHFVENHGQWPADVRYRLQVNQTTVWLCADRIVYHLSRPSVDPAYLNVDKQSRTPREQLTFVASFDNMRPGVQPVGDTPVPFKSNFFHGASPGKWQTKVPHYRSVQYADLYPGVTLQLTAEADGRLTYRYDAEQAEQLSQVAVLLDGAEKAEQSGVVTTPWGAMQGVVAEPTEYAASETATPGAAASGPVGLLSNQPGRVPKQRGPTTLAVEFSTYLGGTGDDFGSAVVVDADGFVYVCGGTESLDFPTKNPYQGMSSGNYNAFVTKISIDDFDYGYSTYLAGTAFSTTTYTTAGDLKVDATGAVYVAGFTSATDFPTVMPYQAALAGSDDAFVTKLAPAGDSLIYSTYLGGSNRDRGSDIAVDPTGHAYLLGTTISLNLPTVNAYQDTYQGGGGASFDGDAFVTKFSPTGNTLVYSTYLGGPDLDGGSDIAVDSAGFAYVCGRTASRDFPTVNPFQDTNAGDRDAFITKFVPAGNALAYSTYVGGPATDGAGGSPSIDATGACYFAGSTDSSGFPLVDAIQTSYGGSTGDAIVVGLAPTGDSLLFSTYWGGSGLDGGGPLAMDQSGFIYVTGFTYSPNFPTAMPLIGTSQGFRDAFVSKLEFTPRGVASCCSGPTGNVNDDAEGDVNLSDLTVLVNSLFVTFEELPCPAEANCSGDEACEINLSDLTVLVNSLFVTFEPTAACRPECE